MRDWLFVYGCYTLVIAVVLLALLPLSANWLVVFAFGAYLLMDAFWIFYAGREDTDSRGRGFLPLEVEGILAALFGVWAWVSPLVPVISTARLIGLWYVLSGLLTLSSGRTARHHLSRPGALMAASALSLLFGIFLLLRPLTGLPLQLTFSLFLAVFGALNLIASRGPARTMTYK